jgi:hypothetical protein
VDEVLLEYAIDLASILILIRQLEALPIPPYDKKKALQDAARKANVKLTKADYQRATGLPNP